MGLLLISGCATTEESKARQVKKLEEKAFKASQETWAAEHAAFRAQTGWKKKTYRNDAILKMATKENVKLEIALSEQRGLLLVKDTIAMDFPIASGKSSHPTPKGSYTIRAKSKDYASNLYGKIVDVTGAVVNENAETTKDAIPEGGSFVGAPMPYWMRLTDTGVGLHIGYVPGRPASHGCIRLPRAVAPVIFENVKIGTPVVIEETAPAFTPKEKK